MSKMIFLDMDGVLCDFVGAALRVCGREDLVGTSFPTTFDLFSELGISEDDGWSKIDAAGRKFWSELDELPWTDELLALVTGSGLPWYLCTSPSLSPESFAGKLDWIRRKFGPKFSNYIFTSKKHLLADTGRLLIDDSEANVTKFREMGGTTLLFPQPWNSNRSLLAKGIEPMSYAMWEMQKYLELV